MLDSAQKRFSPVRVRKVTSNLSTKKLRVLVKSPTIRLSIRKAAKAELAKRKQGGRKRPASESVTTAPVQEEEVTSVEEEEEDTDAEADISEEEMAGLGYPSKPSRARWLVGGVILVGLLALVDSLGPQRERR